MSQSANLILLHGISCFRKPKEEVLVGKNKWISKRDWKKAITARKQGNATKKQIEMLNNGHWRDLK